MRSTRKSSRLSGSRDREAGASISIIYSAIRLINASAAYGSACTMPNSVRAGASGARRSLSRRTELVSASMVPVPRTERAVRGGAALLHIGLGFVGAMDAETSLA